MLSRGDLSYVIRGIGLVKDLEDLGHIVIKTVNGVPVYLNDIGKLKYGNLERKGVLGLRTIPVITPMAWKVSYKCSGGRIRPGCWMMCIRR